MKTHSAFAPAIVAPVTTAPTMAPRIAVEFDFVIAADVESAFHFVANPAHDVLWQSGCRRVDFDAPERPLQEGAVYRAEFDLLGRALALRLKVSALEAPSHYRFESLDGPMRIEGAWQFSPCAEGTRAHWSLQATPGDFFGIIPLGLIRKAFIKRSGEDILVLQQRFA